MLQKHRNGSRKSSRRTKPVQRVNENPENFEDEASATDDELPGLCTDSEPDSSDSDEDDAPLNQVKAKRQAAKAAKAAKVVTKKAKPGKVSKRRAASQLQGKEPTKRQKNKEPARAKSSSSPSSSRVRPKSVPAKGGTLMELWGCEGKSKAAGAAYPAPKTKKNRGKDQSRVPGEVHAKVSILARERAIQPAMVGPPGGGKYRLGGQRNSDLKDPEGVYAQMRLKQFPAESLCVKLINKLYCRACSSNVGNRLQHTRQHCTSTRHKTKVQAWVTSGSDKVVISDLLDDYDTTHNPRGRNEDAEVRVHRVSVLHTLLEAGIPINKVETPSFRVLLERAGGFNAKLTGPSHLLELLPVVTKLEFDKIISELAGQPFTVIWDGTTRVAEVYVVIVRFWKDGKVTQRVIGLKLLDHPLTGPENCGVLVSTAAKVQLDWAYCVQFVADRAGTNKVAVDMLKPQAPKAFLQGCCSHTFTHVGEKNELSYTSMTSSPPLLPWPTALTRVRASSATLARP